MKKNELPRPPLRFRRGIFDYIKASSFSYRFFPALHVGYSRSENNLHGFKLLDSNYFRYIIIRCPFFIGLALPPLFTIFYSSDLIHTHDGLVHLPRLAAYYKALADGQFPVRWVGDLNYGYGMPLFNFIYHVPYFIGSIFIFLGFGLVDSFKISLTLSYGLSGIFMYFFAKEFFSDEKKALVVTLAYQFAPYRFVELVMRGSYGEVYTYTFLPLALYFSLRAVKTFSPLYFCLTSFSVAFLVLSHNSISLVFFAVAAGFLYFYINTTKKLIHLAGAFLCGLLLSSFYWVPAIFEHKYTLGDIYMMNLYKEHFAPFYYFFVPNFYRDPSYEIGNVPVQIGFFLVLGIIMMIYFLIIHRSRLNDNKVYIYLLFVIATSLFFMSELSRFFWENISFLRQFQFPWRFLAAIVFSSSVLCSVFLEFSIFRNKKVFYMLIIMIIFSYISFWKNPYIYDKINVSYQWNYPLDTTYYGETDVIWTAGAFKSYPKERVEIISGEASINDFKKKSNLQTFKINAKTEAGIVSHTVYFPGWRVYVDGKQANVQFQDPNHRGELTFKVPKGVHSVRIVFGESFVRMATDIVSMSTLSGLLLFSIISSFRKERGSLWRI